MQWNHHTEHNENKKKTLILIGKKNKIELFLWIKNKLSVIYNKKKRYVISIDK